MSSPALFRPIAQDAQRTRIHGEIVLVRPVSLTFLVAMTMCMAVAIALLFAFGSYTRRNTVEGVVIPDTGLVKVYAQQPGIVRRKTVVEGQHVTRGMVLYTVSTELQSAAEGHTQTALIEQARQRKHSLLQEIDKTRQLQREERDTLQAKLANLRAELARIDDQLASQRERASIAADGVARYRRLLAQDYISTDQLQQHQADLLDQQSKLLSLQRDRANVSQTLKETTNELAGIALKQQNQLSQISRSVIDVDQTLIESEARRELVVTAPETGVATAVIAEVGQTIDTSHPAASIVPDGAHWQAHLFVPSAAVGFVHVGDPVRVRYQAYPYQKFGQYRARVTSITRTALSAGELSTSGMSVADTRDSDGTYYRVTAALDAQNVIAYGKPQPLQAGMALQADILQERRRLYEWVLEPLYSLTGKL
ncbi:HlyD family secretion protein [Burkholderia cenocepacia]|uniref:HlyD family secretion protein n=1 Tax=Burkholderia cenocepacia TaxID=95486 RepID=UPI001BA7741E|nr:HlyD family efflux transporter periplasmic adaptor subunit [Burkholderia cenocepacia]QUN38656.1 HlyD family efflux transporter periplasmic adaptor subunit [Burkholderia cenocepacia]QUO29441.1 HlyD family efflux transporter periplasmic adaptor subunit [Burkholderia cenocepacia]